MYAAANSKGGAGGVPQSVGQDFVAAGPAGGSFTKLPTKKKSMGPKMKAAVDRGMISQEALSKRGY
jgi:hypothetical protein